MSHYLDSIEGVSHQRGRHSAAPARNEVLKTVLSPPSTITKEGIKRNILVEVLHLRQAVLKTQASR